MAKWVLSNEAVDGLTLSGGEPMAQAESLVSLVEQVLAVRDMSVMCYTGYSYEWLREAGSWSQRRLLDLLDILIDGPFIEDRHAPLRWRGSDNQQLHLLSERHRNDRWPEQTGYAIQCEVDEDSALHFMGILPPGFRQDMLAELTLEGMHLREGKRGDKHE